MIRTSVHVQGDIGSAFPPKAAGMGPEKLTVHYISLLERSRYYRKFITSLPFSTAASILFWSLLLNKNMAISIAMKCGTDLCPCAEVFWIISLGAIFPNYRPMTLKYVSTQGGECWRSSGSVQEYSCNIRASDSHSPRGKSHFQGSSFWLWCIRLS